MVLKEIRQMLAEAAEQLGLDRWTLARRLELPERDVESILACDTTLTVDQLIHAAEALELEVVLQAARLRPRLVGPVPSVVDEAVERLVPDRVVHVNEAGPALPGDAEPEGETQ